MNMQELRNAIDLINSVELDETLLTKHKDMVDKIVFLLIHNPTIKNTEVLAKSLFMLGYNAALNKRRNGLGNP